MSATSLREEFRRAIEITEKTVRLLADRCSAFIQEQAEVRVSFKKQLTLTSTNLDELFSHSEFQAHRIDSVHISGKNFMEQRII